MKSKNIVGKNIRRFRLSAGFTQEELAHSSGLSQGYINQLENGKRNFTQKSLERIAEELKTEMYRLLMEEDIERTLSFKDGSNLFCEFKKECELYTIDGRSNTPTREELVTIFEELPKEVLDHYYRLLVFEKRGMEDR